eukprot:scaffold91444_cov52-Attheya_sp.AAC.2
MSKIIANEAIGQKRLREQYRTFDRELLSLQFVSLLMPSDGPLVRPSDMGLKMGLKGGPTSDIRQHARQ